MQLTVGAFLADGKRRGEAAIAPNNTGHPRTGRIKIVGDYRGAKSFPVIRGSTADQHRFPDWAQLGLPPSNKPCAFEC